MKVIEARKRLSAFCDESDFVIRVNGESYKILGFISSSDNKTVSPVILHDERRNSTQKELND